MQRWQLCSDLPVLKYRPERIAGAQLLLERLLHHQMVPAQRVGEVRLDAQFFNVFNHPNFGLPSIVLAGIPGKPSVQTGFSALTHTTSPPTGLRGVGLAGDNSPRMIAFQARIEF